MDNIDQVLFMDFVYFCKYIPKPLQQFQFGGIFGILVIVVQKLRLTYLIKTRLKSVSICNTIMLLIDLQKNENKV